MPRSRASRAAARPACPAPSTSTSRQSVPPNGAPTSITYVMEPNTTVRDSVRWRFIKPYQPADVAPPPRPARRPAVVPERPEPRDAVSCPAAREREMLDAFHNTFVPEAVKHAGYIRVKMLKRRSFIQGSAPLEHNYRFELEFENEELRQKWIASAGHQRVWPLVERTMTTQKDYPVVLYDEV